MIRKTDYCVDDLRCPRFNICKGKCQENKKDEQEDVRY